MKFRLPGLLLAILLFTGCSEEIDLTAPYQETCAIYGLLNTNDSIQFVRVSKAFLGDGNVFVMAQQYDSVNYANILQVYLQRLVNGVVRDSFPLTRIDTIPKDSGTFYYPGQVLYALDRPVRDDGSQYRLTVINTQTGYRASSTTDIIPDINVDVPSAADADFATRLPITYNYLPTDYSKIHDMEIIFRYREISSSGSVSYHQVLIPFNEKLTGNSLLSPIEFQYYRPDFFVTLGQVIPVDPTVTRRVDNLPNGAKAVEYRFYCGSEDLYTYYQLTRPSEGIAQDRPLFTTVDNGVGLFTSRLIHSEFRNLNTNTRAAFDTSAYTRDLNFVF